MSEPGRPGPLLDAAPADFLDSPAILGDLVGPGEFAVLVSS